MLHLHMSKAFVGCSETLHSRLLTRSWDCYSGLTIADRASSNRGVEERKCHFGPLFRVVGVIIYNIFSFFVFKRSVVRNNLKYSIDI